MNLILPFDSIFGAGIKPTFIWPSLMMAHEKRNTKNKIQKYAAKETFRTKLILHFYSSVKFSSYYFTEIHSLPTHTYSSTTTRFTQI